MTPQAWLRRTRAGLTVAGLIAIGLIATGLPGVPANAAKRTVDRVIKDSRITESSGLAPSLRHPGMLWTHNDSGNPPLIYSIEKSGSTASTLRLVGEPNIDWEAISSFRGPAGSIAAGQALIAIGDIGDNNAVRASVRIAIVREPAELRSATVRPIRVLRVRYPGGPRDAETLLSDPHTGQLYIVSKTLFGSALYSVPLSIWPGGGSGTSKLTTLTRVASMTASFITDGVFLPNGRILLRGYDRVSVIEPPAAVHSGRLTTLASSMLPDQDQGESIALVDGGVRALIGSEGRREPVLRITVPTVDSDRSGATATLPGSTGSRSAAGSSATHPAGFAGVADLRIWVGVIGAAFILVALTFMGLLLRSRRN